MDAWWILLAALVGAVLLVLLISLVCFLMACYAPPQKKTEEFEIPPGEIYLPYRETMVAWMKETRAMPSEELEITSFDGLRLRGRYYECIPGAPIELMFHGYRGTSERDLCGGVQRCFSLGRNVVVVDQRACGCSEGRIITFGVLESRDCLSWLHYLQERFGEERVILLTGISMGAATVLMAAGSPLPPNVVGILADCGYTSPKAIIKKVIRQLHLPADVLYPFVRLGARLYGRFDLEEISPVEAMKWCPVPVLFIHGEADDYVPCAMSTENYEACVSRKRLWTVPEAGHGMSYLKAPEQYLTTLAEFWTEVGVPTAVSERKPEKNI